jgi:hypothetical protein
MRTTLLAALTWAEIIFFALGLSRIKASPELWLALDSPSGSGLTAR